jgi:3-deoxy-D-manno-octulosonic-acid transferase
VSALRHSAAALGAVVGAPVAAAALALRPGWRDGWRERLGGGSEGAGGIWLHAASVGEVAASARLVERLQERGHSLMLSTTSATGRALCRRLHPERPSRLAPLDHPWCVDAALRRVRPRALVLVETELWPVWIAACARAGVPVVVVSGRISDRSFPRYRRLSSVLARTLRRLHAIGARTELDRERFVALGADAARVSVTGDLKLDPPEASPALPPDLAAWLGDAPLIVGGSTHPGEDEALLAAQQGWESAGHAATLLIAPRYPGRAAEVAALVRGRRVSLRSDTGSAPLAAGDVGVLDTLGELSGVYARARVGFVGGTLVPVGGHNVLEPAAVGTPVVYGRHVANARHAAELLEKVGAGERVEDTAGLTAALIAALAEPEASRARGAAGRGVLDAHRGSSERSAALVERALEASDLARGDASISRTGGE